MSARDAHVVYEFGAFRLDATRRLLFDKESSAPVPLTPRVLDVILYFIEHRGELLDKSRLLAEIWPGVVVEENNLAQVISAVRHTLGEAPGENRYLVTAPGRGYRFVADVVQITGSATLCESVAAPAPDERESRAAGRRSRVIALFCLLVLLVAGAAFYAYYLGSDRAEETAAATVATRSPGAQNLPDRNVAVLRFESLSSDAGDEFVASGVAQSVLHRLAAVPELHVISENSSFALQDHGADLRDIGAQLNARYLVRGSVQRDGARLRVTTQLVDAVSGAHIWSLRFDRTIDDIFAVEDEIANSVALALEVRISEQHPFARFGTEAYLAFLQGLSLVRSRKIDDAARAVERFSHATSIAPEFAAAYAALAHAHRHFGYLHEDRVNALGSMAEALDKAEPYVTRALQLDSSLGEAYVTRADIRAFRGDVAGAEADYRHGLALNPNYGVGHEHFADFLWNTAGRIDEALAELDRARRIDPLTPRNHYHKGLILMLEGAPAAIDQAEELFLQSLQVAPDFHPALLRLAQIRWLEGRFAQAVKLGEQAVALDPRAEWMRWFLVDFYLELGEIDAARSVLAEQPQPVHPSQWLTICSYAHNSAYAAELVRAFGGRDSGWFADKDVVAYVLRDAAQSHRELGRARNELENLRIRYADTAARDISRLATLAHVNLVLGNRIEAEKLAREVLGVRQPDGGHGLAHQKAVARMIVGEPGPALDLLEESFSQGYRKRWWYVFDREPAFEPVRSDARFQSLAARAHLHAQAERKLLQEMRRRGVSPMRGASSLSTPPC